MREPSAERSDVAECRAILARGSRSFALATRALPSRLRDPAAVLYAFCRISDDAIDHDPRPQEALVELRARLDAIVEGRPQQRSVDRAMAILCREHGLPRAPLDALLEGYAWDVERRSYRTIAELTAYAVRVAGSVGVAMTVLMGRRDRATLARAVDLGVAMQLTNIARDVGEDARRGRVYLPAGWLAEEGVRSVVDFSPAVGRVVRRLLDHADGLYARAATGIPSLPADCRFAIHAAALLYRGIGDALRVRGYDSVSARVATSPGHKALALGGAAWRTGWTMAADERSVEGPLEEAEILVESVA